MYLILLIAFLRGTIPYVRNFSFGAPVMSCLFLFLYSQSFHKDFMIFQWGNFFRCGPLHWILGCQSKLRLCSVRTLSGFTILA